MARDLKPQGGSSTGEASSITTGTGNTATFSSTTPTCAYSTIAIMSSKGAKQRHQALHERAVRPFLNRLNGILRDKIYK